MPCFNGIVWIGLNISTLGLHNVESANGFLEISYNKTRTDQVGDKVRIKHLHANPYSSFVCVNLPLGVYFAIEASRLVQTCFLFGEDN